MSPDQLWDRSSFTGFTTIPRTMSLVMRIIDGLDPKNAGRVYFDLWCRGFDDAFIDVKDEYEFAFSSGYDGQRAIRSWRERIAVLKNFNFIDVQRAPHGSYRYLLILDPHPVIEALHDGGDVDDEDMTALTSYMMSIGAI